MSNDRHFLITGALGHIGSKLLSDLAVAYPNARITLIDDFYAQRYCSLFNLPETGEFRFIEGDVKKLDLNALLPSTTALFHLAAITDANASLEKGPLVEENNLLGTRRVAEACAKHDVALFYPSSTSVYGSQDAVVDEDTPDSELKPQSPYAESKIKEERLIRHLVGSAGLKAVICRFGTIYGASPGMRFHTAVNKFCWQALTGQKLTVWQTAYEQRRPYLYLGDMVNAARMFIDENLWDGQTYNVVTSNHTVHEVIGTIKKFVNDVEIEFVESRIMNQLSYDVRNTRLDKLDFKFEGSLHKGIEETMNLFSALRSRSAQ